MSMKAKVPWEIALVSMSLLGVSIVSVNIYLNSTPADAPTKPVIGEPGLPVEKKLRFSDRECSPRSHHQERVQQLIGFRDAENALDLLNQRIERTQTDRRTDRFWLSYAYEIDYHKRKIDYVETFCVQGGTGT